MRGARDNARHRCAIKHDQLLLRPGAEASEVSWCVQKIDPRELQISLTGFLEKNTSLFCKVRSHSGCTRGCSALAALAGGEATIACSSVSDVIPLICQHPCLLRMLSGCGMAVHINAFSAGGLL